MTWIYNKLTRAGCRNSQVRNTIIGTISKSCTMFQAQDIIALHSEIDRVTVYRTLDTLASLDIIHPTLVRDGAQYYELHMPEHHHHAICTDCTAQRCVPCEVPSKPNIHHTIFYSFSCNSCI